MHFDPTFRDDCWRNELWRQAMIPLILPAPGVYGRLLVVRAAADALPCFGRQLKLPAPVEWTLVYEDTTLWMSDTPQERLMMLQGTTGMAGHVLVAGGGLGIYPQYLRRYRRTRRITIVERHPDVVALLRMLFAGDDAVEIVAASFEDFIAQQHRQRFDGCFIDIHPTLDPRWLPSLNWLRDQCAAQVTGPLRIWGYCWILRELVCGLEREYLPLLRRGCYFDDEFGRTLARALPTGWQDWSAGCLHNWLIAYAQAVAWPLPAAAPATASLTASASDMACPAAQAAAKQVSLNWPRMAVKIRS